MTNPISAQVLTPDERILVRKGLELLAASFSRKAKSALNSDVAVIYERNAAQVNAFVSKFS